MKILITGASGFIGSNLVKYLKNKDYNVTGVSSRIQYEDKDLLFCNFKDKHHIGYVIKSVNPNIVFHLGGQASVGRSWNDIQGTVNDNIINSIYLIDVCIEQRVKSFILASSAEIYAKSKKGHKETDRLSANNPYALSKLTLDRYCSFLMERGNINTKMIIIRQFPTIGEGQKKSFVISSWADQINKIKNSGIISVGNVDVVRDFLDIRDTIDAYHKLMCLNKSGVYNVCSGIGVSLADILQKMVQLSDKNIDIQVDESRLRPADTPVLIGNNSKLCSDIFWKPMYIIDDTLKILIK